MSPPCKTRIPETIAETRGLAGRGPSVARCASSVPTDDAPRDAKLGPKQSGGEPFFPRTRQAVNSSKVQRPTRFECLDLSTFFPICDERFLSRVSSRFGCARAWASPSRAMAALTLGREVQVRARIKSMCVPTRLQVSRTRLSRSRSVEIRGVKTKPSRRFSGLFDRGTRVGTERRWTPRRRSTQARLDV